MYPALKTFFHEAYGRRLTAIELHNTMGQNGYTNNTIYNAFEKGKEDTDDDMVDTIVTVPQAAATATMAGSSLGTTPGSTVNVEIVAAISQLSVYQTAIMSQLAAMNFAPTTAQDTRRTQHMFQAPPIQQLAIPVQQSFQQSAFNGGRRGGRGLGHGCRGQGCTPFADHMRMAGGIPAMSSAVFPLARRGMQIPLINGGAQMTPSQGGQQRQHMSNIYKRFNNWNVCFSCGFDIENGHTSTTCPFKKANHQMSFTRENAQQFIAVGYDPCTKGIHKSVLPARHAT
jgi:hypothetical protein